MVGHGDGDGVGRRGEIVPIAGDQGEGEDGGGERCGEAWFGAGAVRQRDSGTGGLGPQIAKGGRAIGVGGVAAEGHGAADRDGAIKPRIGKGRIVDWGYDQQRLGRCGQNAVAEQIGEGVAAIKIGSELVSTAYT